ncbi:hypothetical protein D3C73_987050 [compost metagenome]
MAEAGWRMPPHGAPVVLALSNVHGPIDQDGEAQTRARAEFQLAHAPLDAVAQGGKTDSGELRQGAGALGQGATTQRPAIQLGHGLPP